MAKTKKKSDSKIYYIAPDGKQKAVSDGKAEIGGDWIGYKIYLSHGDIESIRTGATTIAKLIGDPKLIVVVELIFFGLSATCAVGGHKGTTTFGTWISPMTPVTLPGKL